MDRIQKICTPVTRFDMLHMKEKEDEKKRWNVIANIVTSFYNEAIKLAKNSKKTEFIFSIKNRQCCGDEKFLIDNKDDIISTLKKYFQDCDIEYRTYSCSRGDNGFMVDITNMDEKMLECFDVNQNETMIVMFWWP